LYGEVVVELVITIQSMAERCGLTAHTLRYYERIGLIRPIQRAENGHRRYSAEDEAWIGFLNRLRATGMSIRQMQQYAELRKRGNATASARRKILEEHKRSIEAEIESLQECHSLLTYKIANYQEIEKSSPNKVISPEFQVEGCIS
jgi:DNA-binding transcriptional MerR regulator